jgi:glutamine amidotransferase-like uncharacterized protein
MSSPGRLVVLCTDLPATRFLLERLETYCQNGIQLEVVEPKAVRQTRLLRDPTCPVLAVFIPGARSSQPFREQMGPKGYEYLRSYVQHGGGLIGICQGFYLLSDTIHYLTADGLQAKGSRQNLGLLPGTTIGDWRAQLGPAERHYTGWHSTTTARLRIALPGDRTQQEVDSFYWGGPVYLPHADQLSIQALGYYDASRVGIVPPIAIAARRIGQGMALGIGPHLEVSSDMLLGAAELCMFDRDDGSYRRQLAAQLAPTDTLRAQLFDRLIRLAAPKIPVLQAQNSPRRPAPTP